MENIGILDAGVIALLGYAVVFFGLILLMIVITILGKAFSGKKKAEPVTAAPAAAPAAEPVVEKTRQKLGDLAKSDEDVLSYIAFPNLAEKFLEDRKAKEENKVTYSIVEC